jgi:hypothetical protein
VSPIKSHPQPPVRVNTSSTRIPSAAPTSGSILAIVEREYPRISRSDSENELTAMVLFRVVWHYTFQHYFAEMSSCARAQLIRQTTVQCDTATPWLGPRSSGFTKIRVRKVQPLLDGFDHSFILSLRSLYISGQFKYQHMFIMSGMLHKAYLRHLLGRC